MISSVERHILVPARAVAFFFCRTLECLAAGVMPSGRSAAEGGVLFQTKVTRISRRFPGSPVFVGFLFPLSGLFEYSGAVSRGVYAIHSFQDRIFAFR